MFRRHLSHYEGSGAPIFVTFTTMGRLTLPPEARALTLGHILHDHKKKMRLLCAVVMPDHVHVMYAPWADPTGKRYTKTEIIGAIKSASSHSINKALGRSGPIWQDESFDRVVRRHGDTQATVSYICENPVRQGLCSRADEYAFTWRGEDEV